MITTKFVVVASDKGGVAKSTTAANVAWLLAKGGKRTLLVDTDKQGHSSVLLGVRPAPGLYNYIVRETDIRECIISASQTEMNNPMKRDNLYILPGNESTASPTFRARIEDARFDEQKMISDMAGVHENNEGQVVCFFDYVVFDTPPTSKLRDDVLQYADAVVIPGTMDDLGIDGILGTIEAAKRVRLPQITIILPTLYRATTKIHRGNLAWLLKHPICQDYISIPFAHSAFVGNCVTEGRSLWEQNGAGAKQCRLSIETMTDFIIHDQNPSGLDFAAYLKGAE